jgi:hypothetical protein
LTLFISLHKIVRILTNEREPTIQTFMPLATTDYSKQAEVLDNRRLNKQALEAWQILMVLVKLDPANADREPKGWVNHPAVKMWKGYEQALVEYTLAMVAEWHRRGYNSTIGDKAVATYQRAVELGRTEHRAVKAIPAWQANQELFDQIARTHRQALLAKEYEHYSQFGWAEDSGLEPTTYEYLWPESEQAEQAEQAEQRTISQVVGDLIDALDNQHKANKAIQLHN